MSERRLLLLDAAPLLAASGDCALPSASAALEPARQRLIADQLDRLAPLAHATLVASRRRWRVSALFMSVADADCAADALVRAHGPDVLLGRGVCSRCDASSSYSPSAFLSFAFFFFLFSLSFPSSPFSFFFSCSFSSHHSRKSQTALATETSEVTEGEQRALPLPTAPRTFFVSPPPSPPEDWTPRPEDAPHPPPPVELALISLLLCLFLFFISRLSYVDLLNVITALKYKKYSHI